jgi:D(-)-tartrate dehydratase
MHGVEALGLGDAEVNPPCFQPFGSYGDAMIVTDGAIELPTVPGIGFELKQKPCFSRL